MHVKKGDKVKIIAGKDKGVSGEVVKALPKRDMVVIAGANKTKKHRRPTRAGQKGQTIEIEMPIHVSNVVKSK